LPDRIIIHADGGSRGNPGPAAAAFFLSDSTGAKLGAQGFFLGQTTNNVAEYTAIVKALEAAKQLKAKQLTVFSDSELLVKQVNGEYKVKSEQIRPLFRQVVNLLGEFESWKVQHITREKNKEADKLANQALNLEQDFVETREPGPGTRTSHERRPGKYEKPIRLGVLISGGGTTLMNILKYIKQGRLKCRGCRRNKFTLNRSRRGKSKKRRTERKSHPQERLSPTSMNSADASKKSLSQQRLTSSSRAAGYAPGKYLLDTKTAL